MDRLPADFAAKLGLLPHREQAADEIGRHVMPK